MAGYEDVWYYLWKERRLPVNLDPLRARLDEQGMRVTARPGHELAALIAKDRSYWGKVIERAKITVQ